MNRGLVGLGFAAGSVAALNPCGFAMLPAYLMLVVRGQTPDGDSGRFAGPVPRALGATLAMGLGFLTVFGLFGALTIEAAGAIERYLPTATVGIGAVLAVLGLWLLAGRELPGLPAGVGGTRWAPTDRLASMYGYGISYALASLSCTIGPFLAVTGASVRSGSVTVGIAVYLAYIAGFTLVVGVLAIAAALAGSTIITHFRRVLPWINRLSGLILVVVGTYVAFCGIVENSLLAGNSELALSAPLRIAARIQGTLAGWVHRSGPWPWIAALLILMAGAVIGARRRRERR